MERKFNFLQKDTLFYSLFENSRIGQVILDDQCRLVFVNRQMYKFFDLKSDYVKGMLPMQGFAQGAQPISSYNFGAHNSARVKQTFRLLLICCCTYSVLLWVAVQIFPQVFASLFTNDTAMVAYTKSALRIYAGAMQYLGDILIDTAEESPHILDEYAPALKKSIA